MQFGHKSLLHECSQIHPMEEVAISFIIPTFNEEKIITTCIDSILRQSDNDFEVIIVDGGSSDKTTEIAIAYEVTVLQIEKNRAHDVSSAKNFGAKQAKGKYVFFLDADMALEPNCVELLKMIFSDDSVIGVGFKVLPLKGKKVEYLMYEINNVLVKIANYAHLLSISYFSCHCYKRSVFLSLGGFRNDLMACEDLDLSIRMSQFGDYIITNKSTLWTSPRRLREWSYIGYVVKYLRYIFEYYLKKTVSRPYDDLC